MNYGELVKTQQTPVKKVSRYGKYDENITKPKKENAYNKYDAKITKKQQKEIDIYHTSKGKMC